MLTAKEGTNFYRALQHIKPAIGNVPYGWWIGGTVPDGTPAYAVNRPAPSAQELILDGGINCAAVANVMLRSVGKIVPVSPDTWNRAYDGGTGAFWGIWDSGRWLKGYYEGYDEPFNLGRAKQWARETRSGVLLGRDYRNANNDQGHVAILLPSGYVLQSFPGAVSLWPGLNWDYTIEASHGGFYYERMVHPANWIDYVGDEF